MLAGAMVLTAGELAAAVPQLESDPSSSAPTTDNTGPIILVLAVGAIVVVFIVTWVGTNRSGSRGGAITNWPQRCNEVSVEGREVVNLAIAEPTGEHGSGLSMERLGQLEGRLDLLIAHLRDLRLSAPSEIGGQAIGLATTHACVLNDIVQTERRIRLSSVSPDEGLLDELVLQFATERCALDEALRDMSKSIADAP
jgi:hypothetical protein